MKKLTLFLFVFLGLFLFSVTGSQANEGTITLEPEPGYKGECFVASVFIDNSYHLLATCRNLPVAVGAENTRLILWREVGEGKFARIGELSRGKLSGTVNDKFERLFISSEVKSSGNTPEGPILAQGNIVPIDFESELVTTNQQSQLQISPTLTQEKVTAGDKVTESVQTGSKIASVFKGIAKAVGLGFLLLLVVVAVLGFMARRKGL